MKVLESQSAVLSNYEVLAHLEQVRSEPRTVPQQHVNVQTILKEVVDYLDPSPPSTNTEIPSAVPPYTKLSYSPETIKILVQRLQPFQLTKAEVLVILNLRPTDLGLLDCVIEECDERLTAEQQEDILKVVDEVLGRDRQELEQENVRTTGSYGEVNGRRAKMNGSNR